MNLAELIAASGAYHATHPSQRAGQAAFNTVHSILPEVADALRGTEADPFYDNGRVPAFWNAVGQALA